MKPLSTTERTRVRREPSRMMKERKLLHEIIDQAFFCHIGFTDDYQSYVIPTLSWRIDEKVYIHGSTGSRMIKQLKNDNNDHQSVCLTFTLLDGIVMARSAFYHSANYRSAMVLGKLESIESNDEKNSLLQQYLEKISPGRWDNVRQPNAKELKATAVLSLSLDEASVKMREGDPGDPEADVNIPVWAGVIPVERTFRPGIDAKNLDAGIDDPELNMDYFGKSTN